MYGLKLHMICAAHKVVCKEFPRSRNAHHTVWFSIMTVIFQHYINVSLCDCRCNRLKWWFHAWLYYLTNNCRDGTAFVFNVQTTYDILNGDLYRKDCGRRSTVFGTLGCPFHIKMKGREVFFPSKCKIIIDTVTCQWYQPFRT